MPQKIINKETIAKQENQSQGRRRDQQPKILQSGFPGEKDTQQGTSVLAAWRVRRRRGGDEQKVAWEATSLPRGAQTDDG